MKTWRRRLLVLYLCVLAVSHAVWAWRALTEDAPRVEPGIETAVVDGEALTDERVWVHYEEFDAEDERTPVVLLHGSPGGFQDFSGLAPGLDGRRTIVPDLPGFGRSRASLPDYSIRAHARYVRALLDRLEIERAHLVGFSMGGGVALELAGADPERVASITMLSAIGVVEYEMFGIHELNHAVHGFQLAGLHLLRWGLPHFGRFDANPLNIAYARNFYDTDQRPLRGMLGEYEEPFLVVHGEADFLVPAAAAREHERIVPQSKSVWFDEGHFLLLQHAELLHEPLVEFWAEVDAGTAKRREDATPSELAAAAEPFDPSRVPPFQGPALLVAILGLIVATFVSEDLTCAFAGLLVSQGRLSFLAATGACITGIFLGDVGLFLLGRTFGRPLLRWPPFKWMLKESEVVRASKWFERKGFAVVMASRFLPGLRLPTYVAGGILRTSFWRFAMHFAIACCVWTPVLVGASAWASRQAGYLEFLRDHPVRVLVLVVAFLFVLQKLVVPLFTHTGRRGLVGAFKRKTQWEFWPPWIFYPPVVAYIVWLAIKHRSLALVTACNPGIPTGGFIGESKSEILEALGDSEFMPRFHVLRRGQAEAERVRIAVQFGADAGYPVVWKPDVGQRGSGVMVCHSEGELVERVRSIDLDAVLQEFAPGEEYGVFYVRLPDEPTGRVFSITHKVLPTLTGDGTKTLERLILDDDRAVACAESYFKVNAERLYDVPAAGEVVKLVELGTHVRGAIFKDGAELITPELEAAIDRLSKPFEGFYFGRYDLRVPSASALARGEQFRVLELNGMTSEATHIYDPVHSVFHAWSVLFEQWRLAFEIACQTRDRGVEPASLGELFREWRRYQGLQKHHG